MFNPLRHIAALLLWPLHKRVPLGTFALFAAVGTMFVMFVAELQYWTAAYWLSEHNEELSVPRLDLAIVRDYGTWVSTAAIAASVVACVLLLGKIRLFGLTALWVFLGFAADGHLYFTYFHLNTWGWKVLAVLAIFAIVLPFLARPITNRRPRAVFTPS